MRWKKAYVKGRKIICLVLSVIICIILFAGAVISAPVPVLALSAGGIKGTIASIVISLLLQTGVAPTNTTWLNQLNTAYGVTSTIGTIDDCIASGLLTETASGLVDTGLSTAIAAAPEYTSLGLDAMFGTTAADVGVTAASGAANLATTAINVGTLGTIGAFAGAAAVGVGLGVLINHVREKIANYIKYDLPGSYVTDPAYGVPSSYPKLYRVGRQYYTGDPSTNGKLRTVYTYFNFVPSDVSCVGYYSNGYGTSLTVRFLRGNDLYDGSIYKKNYNAYADDMGNYVLPGSLNASETANAASFTVTQNTTNIISDENLDRIFNNYNEFNSFLAALRNNEVQLPNKPNISSDYVGPLGNHYPSTDPETGDTVYPGIGNILPEGYDMKPVDMDDYLEYADSANNNTEDGLTGEDTQGVEFMDFIDPYLVSPDDPDQPVDPDQPIIPDNPEVIPSYPDRPVSPDQPEEIPDKISPTEEEMEEALNLTATPDLRGVFPFCIPWDIYSIVNIFDTGNDRTAPHIVFTFPGTNWSIDVDLAVFNPVAAILRVLELVLFIVGLAVATRSLIGAGG